MADARVQSAIDNWASRFIANGVDFNDFVATTAAISRWDQWLDGWTATAEIHRSLAESALEEGHLRTAGEAFLRAAVSYHFAKFVWVIDPARNRRCTEAAVRALYDAHALLDPTAERIEAPFEGGLALANLRLPASAAAAPLAVLIPGLDSTKEEFFALESVFLDRGMATLSLDGPGQGEGGFHSHIRPDYEVAVTAALDALTGRPSDRPGARGDRRDQPRSLLRGACGRVRAAPEGGRGRERPVRHGGGVGAQALPHPRGVRPLQRRCHRRRGARARASTEPGGRRPQRCSSPAWSSPAGATG